MPRYTWKYFYFRSPAEAGHVAAAWNGAGELRTKYRLQVRGNEVNTNLPWADIRVLFRHAGVQQPRDTSTDTEPTLDCDSDAAAPAPGAAPERVPLVGVVALRQGEGATVVRHLLAFAQAALGGPPLALWEAGQSLLPLPLQDGSVPPPVPGVGEPAQTKLGGLGRDGLVESRQDWSNFAAVCQRADLLLVVIEAAGRDTDTSDLQTAVRQVQALRQQGQAVCPPVALVLNRWRRRRGVRRQEVTAWLTQATGLPVLGCIPEDAHILHCAAGRGVWSRFPSDALAWTSALRLVRQVWNHLRGSHHEQGRGQTAPAQ